MMKAIRSLQSYAGAVLVAVLFAGALTLPAHSYAATVQQAGTVTGLVLSLDDVPLPDVRLAAFAQPQSTPDRTPLAQFQSDAQGRYSVQVPAGTVWIEFLTQDIRGESFWGYSNLPVDVAAGETVSGQDFRVAIRIVSEPQGSAVPGMPRTGGGADLLLPFAVGLGLLMLLLGFVQRRRARDLSNS